MRLRKRFWKSFKGFTLSRISSIEHTYIHRKASHLFQVDASLLDSAAVAKNLRVRPAVEVTVIVERVPIHRDRHLGWFPELNPVIVQVDALDLHRIVRPPFDQIWPADASSVWFGIGDSESAFPIVKRRVEFKVDLESKFTYKRRTRKAPGPGKAEVSPFSQRVKSCELRRHSQANGKFKDSYDFYLRKTEI